MHLLPLRLKPATRLEGPLEIVCLAGTLSEEGAHLHMAVAMKERP